MAASKKTPPPAGTGGPGGQQAYLIGRNGPGENKALSDAQVQARLKSVAAKAHGVIGPGASAASEKALRTPLPAQARATTPTTTKPTASRPVKRGR